MYMSEAVVASMGAILGGIASLRGKSRIEKLAALAGILMVLAEASKSVNETDDKDIQAAVNKVAEAVKARAEEILQRIKKDEDSDGGSD